MASALVSTEWLSENLGNSDIKIIHASYFPPNIKRNPREEYAAGHIPGAIFFDIDTIADQSLALPHMLPSADFFAEKISALGITNSNLIVAYDATGLFSAPRAWWMFRAMGHDNIVVLNGGLPKWREESRALTTDIPLPLKSSFAAQRQEHLIRRLDDVAANLTTQAELLVDARSPGRFAGTEPEVWPGRRGGHIPHAINVPFVSLLNNGMTLRQPDELRDRLGASTIAKPLVACCGSGVSACVVALAFYELGLQDVAVYDGSWAEWGLETANHPVETGTLSTGR